MYGYSLSVLAGIPVTWIWSEAIHRLIARQFKSEPDHPARTWWMPMLLGITERAMVTTLVIWLPSAFHYYLFATRLNLPIWQNEPTVVGSFGCSNQSDSVATAMEGIA
jgi:hypothetical protein